MTVEAENFETFCLRFSNETDCVRAFYKVKWPNGFRCRYCNHTRAYVISTRRLPLFECQSCHGQTSLIAGTIMEGSRTPLRLWFQAIFLHCRPQSVNALQLSQIIGVTYKTAWLICHKLRHSMRGTNAGELLSGLVRVMNATHCSRTALPFELTNQEQALLIGSSENENGDIVRIKITKEDKQRLRHRFASPEVECFIREHVDPEAAGRVIVHKCYLGNRNQTLFHIGKKAEEWLAHLFRGIGPKHLQVYLDHFCYVWNRQNQTLFGQLLESCVNTETVTYAMLTGSESKRLCRTRRTVGAAHSKAS